MSTSDKKNTSGDNLDELRNQMADIERDVQRAVKAAAEKARSAASSAKASLSAKNEFQRREDDPRVDGPDNK